MELSSAPVLPMRASSDAQADNLMPAWMDVYTGVMEHAPRNVSFRIKSWETIDYILCRVVSLSVRAMQERPMDEHVFPQAVVCAAERDPGMMTELKIKDMEQKMALKEPVPTVNSHGSNQIQVVELKLMLKQK